MEKSKEFKNALLRLWNADIINTLELNDLTNRVDKRFKISSPAESQAIIAHESDKGACSDCVMVNDCRYAVLKQICRHYIKNPQANVTRPKA